MKTPLALRCVPLFARSCTARKRNIPKPKFNNPTHQKYCLGLRCWFCLSIRQSVNLQGTPKALAISGATKSIQNHERMSDVN